MTGDGDEASAAEFGHQRQGREMMAELEFLEALRQYFHAEKLESVIILAGSTVLMAAGVVLYLGVASQFARGLAGLLLLTGLIGAVVGGAIVLRTDRQVAALTSLYQADRAGFVAAEGARMTQVVKSFRTYRIAYAVAVLTGLGLLLLGGRPLLHGMGVGLLLFAALGFTVDHFAEARAHRYAAQVHAQAATAAQETAR
jgi:hypothetical protein